MRGRSIINCRLTAPSVVGIRPPFRACRGGTAGQKAGFSWLLFGYGPILGFIILICPAAAIKGRPPRDLVALSMPTLLLAVFAVVTAGIHADTVARAVNC